MIHNSDKIKTSTLMPKSFKFVELKDLETEKGPLDLGKLRISF